MAQNAPDQKKQIVADLQSCALLKSVVPMDQVKDILTMVWPNGLPGAIVPMPLVKTSTKADSQNNDRIYEWTIFIVADLSMLSTPYDMEAIIDQVLNVFDNDEELGGSSWPAVDPAVAESFTIEASNKTLTVTPIILKAHALINITP